jgi:hypothetical protein
MRSSDVQGRFNIDYEAKSLYEGMAEDLGGTVGTEVDWWVWSQSYLTENYTEIVDDIYDVSSSVVGGGRLWSSPEKIPVVMAQLVRSTNVMNERGFYVSDTLRLVVNIDTLIEYLPEVVDNPSQHIRDRIVYRGQVFVPTRVLPRGAFGFRYAVATIDCNQVNSEELVNDPQFQSYALNPTSELRTLGYGSGTYGSEPYGE